MLRVEIERLEVSIHAPVMDAKLARLGIKPDVLVSIHAPVMDANVVSVHPIDVPSFNPRARDGRED